MVDHRWKALPQNLLWAAAFLAVMLLVGHWDALLGKAVLRFRGVPATDVSKLVACWSFDDCTARDDSGHGFTGQIHGARCVAGRSGKALLLDGKDADILVPRIYDSIWKQVSIAYCSRGADPASDGPGWVARAVTWSYSDHRSRLYRDGAKDAEFPLKGNPPRGAWRFSRQGEVDDLKVFAKELSPEEVARLAKLCADQGR